MAFGLFLTALILEAMLRLGGCIILSQQAHRNARAMRQKDVYRIMCIGESTTQGGYPAFLERALNGMNLGIRFSVINRGLGGANSSFLVDRMESDLDAYHPDMVVAMMGINDNGPHMPYEPEMKSNTVRFIRALRVYKLARIAWLHITHARRQADDLRDTVAENGEAIRPKARTAQAMVALEKDVEINSRNYGAYMELGKAKRELGNYPEAIAAFQKALAIHPRNDQVYVELGKVCRMAGKFAEAAAAFQKALAINPRNDEVYVELGKDCRCAGKLAESEAALKKALAINPRNDMAYMELGRTYHDLGRFAEEMVVAKCGLGMNPQGPGNYDNLLSAYLAGAGNLLELSILLKESIKKVPMPTDRMYATLSALYAAVGDIGLAANYQRKAEQFRLRLYDPAVADNYHRLKAMLDRRGVKLVCVQYPMRGLEPLRKLFRGQDAGVVFVDNEKAFKAAVRRSSLQEYFRDMFGGDFGHFTDKGNALLAGNIADVLVREVFRE